ncbi:MULTISPECIES: hypothetical protein [Gordonia]|uniref:Uncharacterized protein n=1 Tax=Gordonia amicalis TaxID=89053 RepID=A0ABU4DFW7_9ACTN|nr:hypothetical protein [Gordonia amicalis]MDV6308643.1 hypothetical protein [Gordonia amicalis]MDV7102768.1 hypothetical protein [Gordonia amicalis]
MIGQLGLQTAFEGQLDQARDQSALAGDLDLSGIELGEQYGAAGGAVRGSRAAAVITDARPSAVGRIRASERVRQNVSRPVCAASTVVSGHATTTDATAPVIDLAVYERAAQNRNTLP